MESFNFISRVSTAPSENHLNRSKYAPLLPNEHESEKATAHYDCDCDLIHLWTLIFGIHIQTSRKNQKS